MRLDIELRKHLAESIMMQLQSAIPGSEARLRGSLAEGRSDPYSDIDLLWDIPDGQFAAAVANLPEMLNRVRPLASLRFDPDFQRSVKRRLVFIRFAGMPLFWRVDLDMLATSVSRNLDYDRENRAARGTDWSLTESALMNAIAAVKAHRRGRDIEAVELLDRAEDRIGVTRAPADVQQRIMQLVAAIVQQDPIQQPLADEIVRLVQETFTE